MLTRPDSTLVRMAVGIPVTCLVKEDCTSAEVDALSNSPRRC